MSKQKKVSLHGIVHRRLESDCQVSQIKELRIQFKVNCKRESKELKVMPSWRLVPGDRCRKWSSYGLTYLLSKPDLRTRPGSQELLLSDEAIVIAVLPRTRKQHNNPYRFDLLLILTGTQKLGWIPDYLLERLFITSDENV